MANNKPEFQRVTLDLTRYENQVLNISGKFNARVGDDDDHLPLLIADNGYPQNVSRYTVSWGGTDNEMHIHHHQKRIEDLPLRKGDAPAVGRFTLPFDSKTFNVPGVWNQFFITFADEDGQTVSTVDLKFDVYKNSWMMAAGQAGRDYVEEFEKILKQVVQAGNDETNNIHDLGKKSRDDLTKWITDYKQKIQDALAAVDDPKTGLMARYETLLTMTREAQNTLEKAQFHGKANQYNTVADMKSDVTLMAGDTAIVKGSEDYNDGKGAVYAIRSKRTEDNPDGIHTITLDNGTVAERNDSVVSTGYLADHGIYPNANRVKVGTAHIELGKDSNGFLYVFPEVRGFIGKYGAGLGGAGTTPAGGSEVYDVTVRPVRISATQIDIYISPEMIKGLMADFAMKQPDANVGGSFAYIYSEIYTLQVEFKGATVKSFDIDADFPTNFAK